MCPFFRMQLAPIGFICLSVFLSILFPVPAAQSQEGAMNHFVDGVEALESKDFDDAVASFKKAIAIEPLNLEFQYHLGLTYARQNKDQAALEIFETVVRKEPVQFVKVYYDIAASYSKQKNYPKALEALKRAEAVDPKDPRVYLERGYVYNKIPDYDQAVENFNRAKDLDPKLTQPVYYDIAATRFAAEQFDASEEMFRKTIAVDPKSAIAENARQSVRNVRAARRARKPWYAVSSFGWYYDDHTPFESPVLGPPGTFQVTDEEDQYQSLTFRGGYKFINRKKLEAGAGYALSHNGYRESLQNNLFAHIPHIYLQYNREPVFFRLQYELSYYYTGSSECIQDSGIYLNFGSGSDKKLMINSLMPALTIVEPHNLKSEIMLNFQRKEYFDETSNASNYLAGIIQSYQIPKTEYVPRIGYKFTDEDASDETASYRSHEGLLGISGPIRWGVAGDLSVSYTKSDLENIPDHENRSLIISASLTRTFYDYLLVQLIYSFTKNASNLTDANDVDPSKYRKNVYGFSLTYTF